MDSNLLLGIALIIGLLVVSRVYQNTEVQKTKIEQEAAVQKAEIYKDRHVQQAKIEAQGWIAGFNDSDENNVSTSSDGQQDLSQLLSLIQSPEAQQFISQFLKKQ